MLLNSRQLADPIVIAPQSKSQEAFLASSADIAIFGGAAGCGKTFATLIDPLRWVHLGSNFGAVIFRRTYPQITLEGGLWDDSGTLYPHLGGKPNNSDLYWTFPQGSAISFRHLQYDSTRLDYQGSQIPVMCFDELTHFSSTVFWYMVGRNRSAKVPFKPYIRCTCNPDPDSFVAELIGWWINQETGYPIYERSGIKRWFIRENEKILWGSTRQECIDQSNNPKEALPLSLTFIPGKLDDNKILLKNNPGYRANLLAGNTVEVERLYYGNWKIRPSAGLIFNRGWFEVIGGFPHRGVAIRYWDFAATKKKLAKEDPDFTASCLMLHYAGIFYILDIMAIQEGPAEVDQQFTNISKQDFKRLHRLGISYGVRWEEEGGASGKRDSANIYRMLAGLDLEGIRSTEDKLYRAKGLAVQAKVGNVKIVEGPWNEQLLHHLHHQPNLPHDDIMDSCSGAFNALLKHRPYSPATS